MATRHSPANLQQSQSSKLAMTGDVRTATSGDGAGSTPTERWLHESQQQRAGPASQRAQLSSRTTTSTSSSSGNLSRRDFLRRGSMIGMSAPLLGAILAACGGANTSPRRPRLARRPRAGTPKKGGTLRVATAGAVRRGQPADDLRRRRPGDAQPDRRVPDLRQQPQAHAPADARAELEPEQRRHRVDVQAAPGRHVPQRRSR